MFGNGVTIGSGFIAVVQVIILLVPAVVLAVCIVAVVGSTLPATAARRFVTTAPQSIASTTWGCACASPSNNFHFMSRSAHLYKVLSGRYEMMGEKAKSRGERSRLGKAFSLIIE